MNDLSVITGPGSHSQYLIRALETTYDIDHTTYWPKYVYTYRNEKRASPIFNAASYLLYGLRNRFSVLSNSKWHQDFLFSLYDRINANHIQGKNLIAWPQVSLHSINKIKEIGGKVILEQPMIHVDAWNAIAAKEYNRLGIKNDMIFSESMRSRMNREHQLADRIIVHSSFSKKTFIDNGFDSNKILVCPLGLDITKNELIKKEESKDLQVLFVGRVEVLKGLHFLLDAIKPLGDGIKIHVVGDIFENARAIISRSTANVHYYGQLSGSSLRAIYEKADVLVFPSLYDGFGMVILEAMSFGLPVIASRNSAGPDIIKDFETGFLVEASRANEISERLDWMRNNREATKAMGRSARRLVEKEYSFESYKTRMLNIVRDELGD